SASRWLLGRAGKPGHAFPGLGTLPKSPFVNAPTLRKLSTHIGRTLREPAGATPAAAATPSADVGRYLTTFIPQPLAAAPAPTSAASAVTILPDRGGVAAALEQLLGKTSHNLGAALIDLRALDDRGDDSGDLRDRALAAPPAVRGAPRPGSVLFAHRGLSGAGLPGFAKALAREWPDTVAKAIGFDDSAAPADIAAALAAEL